MLLRRVFWLFGLLIATGAFTPAPSAAQSMNWCRLANPQTCVPGNIRTTFILPTRAPQIWVLPLRRFEKIKEDAEAEGLAPATVAFGRRVVQLISARAILVTSTGTDPNWTWQHSFQNKADYIILIGCNNQPGINRVFPFGTLVAQNYVDQFRCS